MCLLLNFSLRSFRESAKWANCEYKQEWSLLSALSDNFCMVITSGGRTELTSEAFVSFVEGGVY